MTNLETGEVITITRESSGRYRTELRLDGLLQYAADNKLGFTFATVTFGTGLGLTSEGRRSCRTDFLDRIRLLFRKAGIPMKYVWVFSVQLERLLSGDESATPFHFLFACPVGTLPDQQPYCDEAGEKRWRTLSEGSLLTVADLEAMWSDRAGRSLGTVNCGTVRNLAATRTYILQNEREAEAFHVSRKHRFGGSQLGVYGYSRSLRRKVRKALETERKARPELEYNSLSRKNGTVTMRVVSPEGVVIREKVVRSPWTSDPARRFEHERREGLLSLKRGLRKAVRRSMLAGRTRPVPVPADAPVQPVMVSFAKPVVRSRKAFADAAPSPANRLPRVWHFRAVGLPITSDTESFPMGRAGAVEPLGASVQADEVLDVVDAIDTLDTLDAVIDRPVTAGIGHAFRRVLPADGGLGVSMGDLHPVTSPAGASLTTAPRPAACGDMSRGASLGEYPAPEISVHPASSPTSAPAPACCLAGLASEHGAQVDAPAKRALDSGQGDTEAKLATYMRWLGLHLDHGDFDSGTPDGCAEDIPGDAA